MAIGSIILVKDGEPALRPLLGAPVLLRAVAATLLPREEVTAVVVAPQDIHAAVHRELDRFGLSEVVAVLAPAPDMLGSIAAALEKLPKADHIIIQDGLAALTPVALCLRVLEGARREGAAVGVQQVRGRVFVDAEALRERVLGAVCVASLPLALSRAVLEDLVSRNTPGHLLDVLVDAGVAVSRVDGDRDVFALQDEADVTRALEVFGRRAPDYAFLWPRPVVGAPTLVPMPSQGAELNVTIPEQPANR